MPELKGTLAPLRFESRLLQGNPLGDPHVREVPVYLPPSYFTNPSRRFPTIYALTGFTGKGTMLLNDSIWVERFDARVERLIRRKKLVESIVVMPDCSTRYGGSQYLNSSANGRYEDHLVRELVPYIDRSYRTIRDPRARAVMGKSSGGYGAIMLGMRHPDQFGLVACHSGDMYFELCYGPDIVKALRLLPRFGGAARFFRGFPRFAQKQSREIAPILNVVAMAMAYSPRAGRTPPFELPFDERTGERKERVWREWLRWDPVVMAARYRRNLRKLRLLYLDCGTRDEYLLHFGARILARRLRSLGVRFVHEEFDDGHGNIQYRYDRSLALFGATFRRELRSRL
jgi:S-formylglutathione hydrolase FrmB